MCDVFTAMAVGQSAGQGIGAFMQGKEANKNAMRAAELAGEATSRNMATANMERAESRVASAQRTDEIQRQTRRALGTAAVAGGEAGVVPTDVASALIQESSRALSAEEQSQDFREAAFDRQLGNLQFQQRQQREQFQTQELFSTVLMGLLGVGGAAAQGRTSYLQYQNLSNPTNGS